MNSLKKGEGVLLLNFEGRPGVLLLNFEGGPGVSLLNFRVVPGPTFKLWGESRGPGTPGPGPTFTPCRIFGRNLSTNNSRKRGSVNVFQICTWKVVRSSQKLSKGFTKIITILYALKLMGNCWLETARKTNPPTLILSINARRRGKNQQCLKEILMWKERRTVNKGKITVRNHKYLKAVLDV